MSDTLTTVLPWYRTGKLPALFYAFALAVIVVLVPQQSTSRGDANIMMLAALGGATLLTSCWFSFLSTAPYAWRKNWAVYSTGAALLFLALFEVDSTSGDVLPRFRPRWWGQRADYSVDQADHLITTDVRLDVKLLRDYPGFLGPHRDASLPAVALAHDWDKHPWKKIWGRDIGAGWSSFAISGDAAVTMEQRGTEECVTCYDAATGRLRWKHATPGRFESKLGGDGPRATPTIVAGRVYALGATGNLSALDLATGKPLWPTRNILKDVDSSPDIDAGLIAWGRSASVLVVGKLLVVPGGGPDTQRAKSLLGYDQDTGTLVMSGGNQQVSYSSPSLYTIAGTPQIVIVNETSISGHDPQTLVELWQIPWAGGSSSNASAPQTHLLPDDRLFVSKGYGVGAMVFRVSRDGDNWLAKKVWHNSAVLKTKFSNPVVVNGYAYGLSDGRLQCADLKTGKRQWSASKDFGHGQMLALGELLLILAEDGELCLCEANPDRYVLLTQQPVLQDKSWSNPVLAGKYLFVRNASEAACYEMPEE